MGDLLAEESLLGTLAAKHELALAALDPDSQVTDADFRSGIEELKKRLECLARVIHERSSRNRSGCVTSGQAQRRAMQAYSQYVES